MSAKDNNYDEILEEITDKLNSLDSIKEIDMLEIKNSVESIESLITDTQAKLNFSDSKEKLETISLQVDNCNEALLKDLFNDINELIYLGKKTSPFSERSGSQSLNLSTFLPLAKPNFSNTSKGASTVRQLMFILPVCLIMWCE